MSTNGVISTGRRRRRRHSELFKAEAVGACQQEGGIDCCGGAGSGRKREPATTLGTAAEGKPSADRDTADGAGHGHGECG